ncbi:N-acetylmuramoyl-L-alanine amidase [Rickettsiales bacterium]|nr:N-acetylmuramoyl-L-alanine amidase [Rickettsiales bacterium]
MKFIKSPNFSVLKRSVRSIVLHYTQVNLNETLKIFLDEKKQLSSHYVVSEVGEVIQLVKDEDVAWHAGKSYWRGVENLNNSSIGIELVNDGKSKYPVKQITSLIKLLDDLRVKFVIDDINIIGHSDIAPLRKDDPGIMFPWDVLYEYNHGVFVPYAEFLQKKSTGDFKDLKNNLIKIGYSESFCNDLVGLKKVKNAFIKHYACSFGKILTELEIFKLSCIILAEI